MASVSEMNLREIEWPVSLLLCNRAVCEMRRGDRLDVLVDDPDVADNLMLIVRHIDGRSARLTRKDGYFTIAITRR